MSKEIQCKCCKEYWWEDNIHSTSGLCPNCYDYVADLEAKLAESENKLNQYPYKNDVIEEQYEDLKDAITFLMLNNIKDQEQLNYSIDVLCEKHKARIRDIENSICNIEKLKQQLAEKEKEISNLKGLVNERDKQIKNLKTNKKRVVEHKNKVKIDFAVEQLEKVKEVCDKVWGLEYEIEAVEDYIDDQIKQLTEGCNETVNKN